MDTATGFIQSKGASAAPVSGDGELIAAARTGSAEAITALVRRHWRQVHRAAYLIVQDASAAEDIAQESLIAAVDALDRFDERRPLGPWLNRIAVNNSLKWLRASSRRREISSEVVEVGDTGPGSPSREISDETLAALAALEPSQRAVIVLRYLLDCTPGEIAKTLKVPRGTVNSRLRRALDRLGAELGEELA